MRTIQSRLILAVAAFMMMTPALYAQPGADTTAKEKEQLLQEIIQREKVAEMERQAEGPVQAPDDSLMRAKEGDRADRMSREERDVEEGTGQWWWRR